MNKYHIIGIIESLFTYLDKMKIAPRKFSCLNPLIVDDCSIPNKQKIKIIINNQIKNILHT